MSTVNWRDYALTNSTRKKEPTEWSISYSFSKNTPDLPRVLLIGDSICNFYQKYMKELLDGKANLTYWVSSKCVTDPSYLPELDLKLDIAHYDVISFNNGLHSLSTVREEWDEAFGKCVDFIRAKCPEAKLHLTLSTPLKDPALTAVSASLNETVRKVAEERGLPVIDLFSLMDPLDRETYWSDVYHFGPEAVKMQADVLMEALGKELA